MKRTDLFISENLSSFRADMFGDRRSIIILRCMRGSMQVKRHSETLTIKKDDLLICLSDYLIGHYSVSENFKCRYYACPQHELARHAFRCLQVEPNWWEKLNYMLTHPIIHMTAEQKQFAQHFHHSIDFYLCRKELSYQDEILDLMADLAIYELLSHINRQLPHEGTGQHSSQKKQLISRFMQLLQENVKQEREVQWYASQLAITPKYLTVICKEITGKSAIEIITEGVITLIKNELVDTDDSVKQIAFRYKFSSPSFFCKYFRQHIGMTPQEYRAAHNKSEV